MKAIILAGGQGTRGKPFTDYFPKAMIPVEGKPLIDHLVRYLFSFSFINEIIILADYKGLGGQIKTYFENRVQIRKKKLTFIQDSKSGTGGDLVRINDRIRKNSEFLLWFVDNLSAIDLTRMYKFYKKKKNLACIATRRYRNEETGYAVVKNGLIIKFIEKPKIKMQMEECLGVYILNAVILRIIKSKRKKKKRVNLSFDVLQELSKKNAISAFDIGKTPWIDVDSPIKIERSRVLVKQIIKKMKS